jgi:methionyl-tRNA synthetase
VNRVLTFVESKGLDVKGEVDPAVAGAIRNAMDINKTEIGNYEFKKVCDSIITLADFGNTYFQSHEPWKLIKEDRAACENVLYNCAQIVKALAILSWPTMPVKAEEIWGMLGYDKPTLQKERFENALVPYVSLSRPKPAILFSKLEDKKIAEMENILNQRVAIAEARASGKKVEEAPKVSIEEFQKIEIKIGKVVSSERVKGSKKLLKSMIDVGEAKPRQVVSGIAEQYAPEEMVGKVVVVITNLKPAKIMGVESNGMLMAADSNGATLLVPEKPSEPGTKVR